MLSLKEKGLQPRDYGYYLTIGRWYTVGWHVYFLISHRLNVSAFLRLVTKPAFTQFTPAGASEWKWGAPRIIREVLISLLKVTEHQKPGVCSTVKNVIHHWCCHFSATDPPETVLCPSDLICVSEIIRRLCCFLRVEIFN